MPAPVFSTLTVVALAAGAELAGAELEPDEPEPPDWAVPLLPPLLPQAASVTTIAAAEAGTATNHLMRISVLHSGG
jgi:hypothetical protein